MDSAAAARERVAWWRHCIKVFAENGQETCEIRLDELGDFLSVVEAVLDVEGITTVLNETMGQWHNGPNPELLPPWKLQAQNVVARLLAPISQPDEPCEEADDD